MTTADAMSQPDSELARLIAIAKTLAVQYRRVTGKPLGVSGEIAEFETARALGLRLSPAGTQGYHAERVEGDRVIRYQIKSRVVDPDDMRRGQLPAINPKHEFDFVLLALVNRETLDLVEIWQAGRELLQTRLEAPDSKARNERGSLGIAQFMSIAEKIWEADRTLPDGTPT